MDKKLTTPKYSLGEEITNTITHGMGSIFAILAIILLIPKYKGNTLNLVCVIIYCASLFLLYTVSSVYHALAPNKAKSVFRKLDHCSIFLLIAGTYTPICIIFLNSTWGLTVLSCVWAAAIVGIVFNSINVAKFEKFSMICYLAMGWSVIIIAKSLLAVLNSNQLVFLVTGGIFYTIGAIIYLMGKKIKYMHSIWHIFVLVGSVCHFIIFC